MRVDKTKVTSRNAFIGNLLELEKEKKITKGTLFETIPRFLTCLLVFTPQIQHICGSINCFSFRQI